MVEESCVKECERMEDELIDRDPQKFISAMSGATDKQIDDMLRYIRKMARESERKREIVESIAIKQGLSPIAYQRALEKAMENKASIWREFRDAPKRHLLLCEEHKANRDNLAKELRKARSRLGELRSEARTYFKRASDIALSFDMPRVPFPERTRDEWALERDIFAGVYVAFYRGCVQYVGESCNIPSRMRSHEKVESNWLVSVIKTEPAERFFAECFYIWLLKPPLNKEGIKFNRATQGDFAAAGRYDRRKFFDGVLQNIDETKDYKDR